MAYNESALYNEKRYNGNTLADEAGVGSTEDIVFSTYGMQNDNICVSSVNIERSPVRDFLTVKSPRAHGRIISSNFWDFKRVTLTGMFIAATQTALDDLIDLTKKSIQEESGNLDIKRADGTYRRFIATATDIDVQRDEHFDITACPFQITFECLVPFGQDVAFTSAGFSTSALVFTENEDNEGTAEAQPIFIMVVNAASGITAINLSNNTTSQELEITTSISAGQVIKFDSENKQVLINGSVQEYDGTFPHLDTGSNNYTITSTGTSIQYELTLKYKKFYL